MGASGLETHLLLITAALAGRPKLHARRDAIEQSSASIGLICVRGICLRALEVKSDRGQVTRAQQEWLDALGKVQLVTAHIVRPADWEFVRELLQ